MLDQDVQAHHQAGVVAASSPVSNTTPRRKAKTAGTNGAEGPDEGPEVERRRRRSENGDDDDDEWAPSLDFSPSIPQSGDLPSTSTSAGAGGGAGTRATGRAVDPENEVEQRGTLPRTPTRRSTGEKSDIRPVISDGNTTSSLERRSEDLSGLREKDKVNGDTTDDSRRSKTRVALDAWRKPGQAQAQQATTSTSTSVSAPAFGPETPSKNRINTRRPSSTAYLNPRPTSLVDSGSHAHVNRYPPLTSPISDRSIRAPSPYRPVTRSINVHDHDHDDDDNDDKHGHGHAGDPRSSSLLPRWKYHIRSLRTTSRPRITLAVLLAVFLLIGIITFSNSNSRPGNSGLNPSPELLLDEVVEEVVDDIFLDPDFSRSFEEPDFALLSGKQPHEIQCDVPVDWQGRTGMQPDATGNEEEAGVLVLLGVFSALSTPGKSAEEMKARRDLYRTIYWPDFPDHLVTKKFILGLPPPAPHPTHPAAVARSKAIRILEQEAKEHGDMVILDLEDNVDEGKTHAYFRWAAQHYAGDGRVRGRPRFVMKTDDDTLLVAPNMIESFRNLDCDTNVYWGTSAGRSSYFGRYFRGLAYAMSWPLVSWIGSADMPNAHIVKIEDARTGQWLRHLNPVVDPIHRIDNGWTMADWNQVEVTVETMALHWCKWNEWVIEQHNRILTAWKESNRPYEWDRGLSPDQILEKGRQISKSALEEFERQKAMGWDVSKEMLDLYTEDEKLIPYGT